MGPEGHLVIDAPPTDDHADDTRWSLGAPASRQLGALAGRHVVFLNWRDLDHPQAGGAELFCQSVAARFAAAGIRVTLLTAQPGELPATATANGVRVSRGGGTFGVYPSVLARLARLARSGRGVDAVVDCQNGIPFFSPLVLPRATPVVQVLHHVHQKQFPLYFPGPVARVGQLLEAPGSRWIYRRRPVAVVSPSTRDEARAVLDLPGPRFLVPNGVTVSAVDDTDGADDTVDGSGATGSEATGSEATGATRRARVGTTGGHGTIPTAHQAAAPTIVCVGRLVPHKRLHLLIEAIPGLVARHPGLVVHIVGDGPDRERLAARATELGVGQGTGASGATLRWHGFAAAATRDALLSSAWLTVNPSHGEGWGLSVLEANALGVPAVAFRVPGLRDAVRDGETGWLVDSPARLGDALDAALARMADPLAAARMRATARRWAAGFTWETSAAMLAAIITAEIDRAGRPDHRQRDDAVTVAEFPLPATAALPALRRTDLVYRQGVSDVPGASGAPGAVAVLYGAVPAAARAALRRAGVDADVRLRAATGSDLLLGTCQAWRPASAAPAATAEPVGFGPAPLPAVS